MSYAALVFSHSITPRIRYIVDFLSQYYGLAFRLTSDEEKYLLSNEPCRINYSYHRLVPGEIFIHSHALLSESYIRPVKIESFEKQGYKAFFRTAGDIGFDLFAAIFFLLTRYEEYLPFQKDNYGRFSHKGSTAFQNDFLHLPLINIWLEDFRMLLAEKNAAFRVRHAEFSFLPTYDVDMAWSFRNKGWKRNAGAILRLLGKVRLRRLAGRIRVLRGKKQDPYDAYEWMDQLHTRFGLKPVYFFLVARDKSRYDKNIDPANPEFRRLIGEVAGKYETGLHPSWHSNEIPSLLTSEKQELEVIKGRPVYASRQHFIRFELPVTYRRLIALGITDDYSMGYGSINGFRASFAGTFYWYDLKKEEKTNLRIHPFCFMDANSCYEQLHSPEAALAELAQYYQAISSVHGKMITIWHNSFLGSDESFKGWREAYESFVSMVSQKTFSPDTHHTG